MSKVLLRQWLQLSGVWLLVAAIPAGRAWLFYFNEFWFYIYILTVGLALAPFLIAWFSYLQRRGKTWVFIVVLQVTIAFGLASVYHTLTVVPPGEMRKRVSERELDNMPPANRMTFYALSGTTYSIFTSFIILSAIGLLIVYNEQARQRSIRESALRESLTRAQIKALQSELQPHFIFNTLHSVNSLMETDVEKAQELIEQFSFLMRQYLAIIEKSFYTVREEVEFLKEYVAVLQYRYTRKISLNASIGDDCIDWDIPVILLQPVVENCIKHGGAGRSADLIIDLTCSIQGGMIVLKVKDNGTEAPANIARMGVGLRNLRERLSFIYDDKYLFLSEFDNGYVTTISLPADFKINV